MMLILLSILCFMMGFIMLFLTKIQPLFGLIYFDYIGLVVCFLPTIIILYRMIAVTRTYTLTEKIPKWKHYIAYMRRDNTVIPLYGKRTYPGESFIDVPQLGLVEFLGKDCWYNWGDKKILWGLENMCYTPDPRYSNLCHLLSMIGFSNSDEIRDVLNGNDLNLMGKTFLAMNEYDQEHGIPRLIQEMKTFDKPRVVFKDHLEQGSPIDTIRGRVDELLKKKNAKKPAKVVSW